MALSQPAGLSKEGDARAAAAARATAVETLNGYDLPEAVAYDTATSCPSFALSAGTGWFERGTGLVWPPAKGRFAWF